MTLPLNDLRVFAELRDGHFATPRFWAQGKQWPGVRRPARGSCYLLCALPLFLTLHTAVGSTPQRLTTAISFSALSTQRVARYERA
jgi:hypothetical protein